MVRQLVVETAKSEQAKREWVVKLALVSSKVLVVLVRQSWHKVTRQSLLGCDGTQNASGTVTVGQSMAS